MTRGQIRSIKQTKLGYQYEIVLGSFKNSEVRTIVTTACYKRGVWVWVNGYSIVGIDESE